jgi:hypothetical protein
MQVDLGRNSVKVGLPYKHGKFLRSNFGPEAIEELSKE